MINNISRTLIRYANGRNILIFLALFIVMNAAILPWAGGRIDSYSGGVGPIDLQTSYTPAQVYAMVAAYGEQGRSFYILFELIGDSLYPLIYGGFFALLLTFLWQRALPANQAVQKINVLPVILILVDFVENAGIITLLATYPSQLTAVAQITSLFTSLKWILFGTSIVAILAGFAFLALAKLRPTAVAH
jgi:hypothetical protein